MVFFLLVSDDFVQDPSDEEEKSMKRKYHVRCNIRTVQFLLYFQFSTIRTCWVFKFRTNRLEITFDYIYIYIYPVIVIEIKSPKRYSIIIFKIISRINIIHILFHKIKLKNEHNFKMEVEKQTIKHFQNYNKISK